MKTLIVHAYVVTVDADFRILHDGALCYEGDCIIDIGSTDDLLAKYPNAQQIDASKKVVMPGLINTHLHSGLIRGTAEDLPVWEWLEKHVDPKHMVLQPEDAYIASKVCYSESLLAGTTTVVDMYRHMHRCADSAKETGIRAILAPYVGDREGLDYFETIDANERLYQERHGDADGRISVWFGLEHIVYCSKDAFRRVAQLAEKYDTGIHTHGEESIQMANMIRETYGCSPLKEFYNRGILGPKTLLAHCCWITPEEIEIMRATGTSIAHCPVSNMKLASGICPVPKALEVGIHVGIGSDGIKENNNVDLFEEMKFAALIQKLGSLDARVMPAEQALKLATIEGAKAIAMEDSIGSLEVGKKADIVILDINKLHMAPHLFGKYENIVPNIVHSASGADVDMVIVNGEVRVKDHQLLGVDVQEMIETYTRTTQALIERREEFVPKEVSIHNFTV